MSSSEDLQYPRLLLEYRDGFLVSKAMFAACELGVFDLLHDSGTPLSSVTIAEHLHASADGIERLLCACVGLKLLEIEKNNSEEFYKNTDLSAIYLTKSSPKSLHTMMMYFSDTVYKYSEYLADAVREGTTQNERAFGISTETVYEGIYRSDEELLKFMHVMNSFWVLCGRDVITAFDLSPFSKVCDIGGSTGALAKQYLLEHPNSTAIIYDLPKVVQTAKKHFISPDEHHIQFLEHHIQFLAGCRTTSKMPPPTIKNTHRLPPKEFLFHCSTKGRHQINNCEGGDFFEDPVPEADLYIISQILHCFNHEACMKLLSKVYNSCMPGGGVLLVESFLKEDKSGPSTTQFMNFIMLLRTEGKEKTSSEYIKLLKTAGFRDIEVKITGKLFDAILARK
ncbi:acetylserotonin O-methyltransferase-like isoform X2 [Pleurodeles waltl]|uniref:acetylserotonin O-methyltransferase-like isoform X2 n=1 Tax=Pleurodeles waltl TaxID=8319 RepID=UPI00370990C3